LSRDEAGYRREFVSLVQLARTLTPTEHQEEQARIAR
jgi:hypothetical protein